MATPAPSDGPRHLLRDCRRDVSNAYQFFLGRMPESMEAYDRKVGLDGRALIDQFIDSPEFLVRVRDKILCLEKPSGGIFDNPPKADLREWAAAWLPLHETSRDHVASAASWIEMYWHTFHDSIFGLTVNPTTAFRFPFLEHLDALRSEDELQDRDALCQAVPTWVLITGAPRSGTSLLRAILAEHPNVAVLQEYGLGRLIACIDEIIGRPSIQQPSWDNLSQVYDAGFADVASFYQNQLLENPSKMCDGQFAMQHFNAVALGIMSVLAPGKHLRVLGDKMPMSNKWEDIPLLLKRLPGLKILVMLRDPGSVVASSLNRRAATERGRDTWPIRNVQEAAAQWTRSWRTARELQSRYAERVHMLKYEDLCADPDRQMADVYAFLDLPVDRAKPRIVVRPADLVIMSRDERDVLNRLLGDVSVAWSSGSSNDLFLRFQNLPLPCVLDRKIEAIDEDADLVFADGFSAAQGIGRWTNCSAARLEFRHGEVTGILLTELFISAAMVNSEGHCNLVLQARGGPPSFFRFEKTGGRAVIATRAGKDLDPGTLMIDVILQEEKQPSGDMPPSGICVEAFRLTHIPNVDVPTSV